MSDYSEQWDDLEEKDILIGILTELQQIRLTLQGAENEQEEPQQVFECDKCGTTVPKDERERHAIESHNAPKGMVDSLFSEV